MKKIKVLVIPAGSRMAVPAIKALKQDRNIAVISADVNKLAPGLYLSDKGYLVPPFKEKSFYSKLKKIVAKEKIDVIIPALDTILLEFSKRKKEFKNIGAKILVSDSRTIEITRDKWKTYNKLKNLIPLPKSFIEKDAKLSFPLFIKPRHGSGSVEAYRVNSQKELEYLYNKIENPIIQEHLEGKEYTVDCLADMDGNLVLSIPRERIEIKAGVCSKSKIVENKKLDEMAKKIAQRLKFAGPFFFQTKEDKEKIPRLTEINARLAGTMILSSFSGPNLHVLAVKLCVGEKIRVPKIKRGLYLTRFLEEIYLTEKEMKKKLYVI